MQIEDAVMLLVLDHVVVAMGTHSHDPQVTHWGSKVIAHVASNGKDIDNESLFWVGWIGIMIPCN